MSELVLLRDHITIQKGKPPLAVGYVGADAAPYLNPDYLRGKSGAEPAKGGSDAVYTANGETLLLWDGSNAGEFFRAKKGLVASTMAKITPDATFDSAFFFHVAKHAEAYVKNQTGGTGIPHVDRERLESIRVFRPILDEQLVIAKVLDTLDTAIRETESLIDKLKSVKQGLLHDLLTRGIDANGHLRPPQSEAPQLYKESPLGWIPREWEFASLAEVSSRIGDGVHYAVERNHEGVPFLFVSCIRNGKIDWQGASFVSPKTYQEISKRSKPIKGMVLFTVVGSYGHAGHVDADLDFGFERNIAFVIPNNKYLNSKYLFYSISTEATRTQVERLVIGNAQKVLTLSALNSIVVSLPRLSEQAQIISRLDALIERQEHEDSMLEKLLAKKKGLMDDLLTGRVRVTSLLQGPSH